MSAHPPLAGMIMADSWPMARVLAGASAVPMGHAIDLAYLFGEEDDARHDALLTETRRQLGGCVTAVEMALRLSLAHAPAISTALDAAPASIAWPVIRGQPTLISPPLMAHMRLRAAVALMLRQYGQGDLEQMGDAPDDRLPSAADPDLGAAVAALALAEGRWLMPGGEDQPIRPDLPAELFADLLWTVAACLAHAVQRVTPDDEGAIFAAFDRSSWATLADHDESANPIAQADRLVRQLGEAIDDPALIGVALDQRRFLLFCALAAQRLRLPTTELIAILLLGPVRQVASLCRALGGSDADYRLLLLTLRPVRPSLTDATIVAAAEGYARLSQSVADAAVTALRTPVAFRARLDHLRGMSPA